MKKQNILRKERAKYSSPTSIQILEWEISKQCPRRQKIQNEGWGLFNKIQVEIIKSKELHLGANIRFKFPVGESIRSHIMSQILVYFYRSSPAAVQ